MSVFDFKFLYEIIQNCICYPCEISSTDYELIISDRLFLKGFFEKLNLKKKKSSGDMKHFPLSSIHGAGWI